MPECIFCKIADKQIASSLVYEDEDIIVFNDIGPKAPVHILIVPKEHFSSILEIEDNFGLIAKIFKVAKKLAQDFGIAKSGFRVVNNCGADAGQAIEHIHFHLLGGRKMDWPPG